MNKKVFNLFVLFILLSSNLGFCAEPTIASTAAILIEASTGKILYEKNAYEKMYPASTTKVMTAILTLENCDLDEMAKVSKNAIFSIPSGYVNANLRENEEMSIQDFMYALMVKSANDVAIVLAEHISGSVEAFADKMNEKAMELGCKNTHFVNPNGIHDENHYSTAYDLSLIAAYAMKNETFRKFVSTSSYTLPATNLYPTSDRLCVTTNDMLRPKSRYYNETVNGIKTGYTTEAKNCLIAGAQKNGTQLISVVLHAGTNEEGLSERYLDTNALFDYGFEEFEFSNLVEKNSVVQKVEIENGSKDTKNLDLIAKDSLRSYFKKETALENVTPEITLKQDALQAPIVAGSTLGNATYTIDGISYTTELLASHDVEKNDTLKIILLIGGILLLILGFSLLRKQNRKTKKKKIRMGI